MAILPKHLRREIIDHFIEGLSSLEVFDLIYNEASKYVSSDEQLSKCIASLKGKATLLTEPPKEKKPAKKALSPPKPKPFDNNQYLKIIDGLSENMPRLEFERACVPVVLDILKNYEGFANIHDANKAEGFHNPPFDFLGFKDGLPYIIEFKGSLKNFNSPGETQKRRMQELLDEIEGLNAVLLQVKLRSSEYRILNTEEMKELLFDGRKVPIQPVVKWIRGIIKDTNM